MEDQVRKRFDDGWHTGTIVERVVEGVRNTYRVMYDDNDFERERESKELLEKFVMERRGSLWKSMPSWCKYIESVKRLSDTWVILICGLPGAAPATRPTPIHPRTRVPFLCSANSSTLSSIAASAWPSSSHTWIIVILSLACMVPALLPAPIRPRPWTPLPAQIHPLFLAVLSAPSVWPKYPPSVLPNLNPNRGNNIGTQRGASRGRLLWGPLGPLVGQKRVISHFGDCVFQIEILRV